jgi:Ca-activated chloride channel family protein
MKISARIDRSIVGPSGGCRYLWLQIEAPRRSGRSDRAPVDIALVLDRSGSMGGRKIALARHAAKGAAQLLRNTDRCALVAYDDRVVAAVPSGFVDASQRSLLSRAVDSLDARGSTDLFGGWAAGAEQVSEDAPGRIRRVLVLTDGLANVGIIEPDEIKGHVRELHLRGVGTTTFGIGADFDEVLVSGMAEAGGGHFYFIERPEQIPDFLASELGELLSVIAGSVQMTVEVSGNVSLQCLNDVPIHDGRYQLGDISEAAVVDLLFALDIAPRNTGPITLQVNLAWLDADSQEERRTVAESGLAFADDDAAAAAEPDAETVRQVVRVRGARVREEALVHNRKGDYRAARAVVHDEMAELRSMAASVPAAQADLNRLDELNAMAAEMTAMEQKRAHFESYKMRRSRPHDQK